MRNFLCAVYCLLSSTGLSQLIENQNFEAEEPDGQTFKSWNTAVPSAISKDEDPINGGKYVLKFKNPNQKGGNLFSQRIDFKPNGFSRYHFSGYVKSNKVDNGYTGIWLRAFDKNGIKLTYIVVEDYALKGTNGWTKVGFDVDIAASTAYLELGGLLVGDGTAWFDQLSLQKLKIGKIGQTKKARKYLESAIFLVSENAMRKDSVDFEALVDAAKNVAANAKKPADCYTAIRTILTGLNDQHSFLKTSAESKSLTTETDIKIEWPTARLVQDFGYVKIPAFEGINENAERKFADSLQSLIRTIDGENTKGWIVDLRNNTGGNMWPMLAGIGPVLGDGIASCTVYKNKRTTSGYRNGETFHDAEIVLKIKNPYLLIEQNPYVAVLTNDQVASSGESIVLAFKNRPKARSYGQQTYGLTTANADFTLSDGAMIFVTSGVGADRDGNLYGKQIQPDEWVDDNEATPQDEVLDAALQWLKRQTN